jgi:hypothetical protein
MKPAKGIKVEKGLFPWMASGRAVANGRDEGFTKLLFDADTKRIVGGGIVGARRPVTDCAGLEMGADAVDIGKTIHPHPTLGESIGMAAEVLKASARFATATQEIICVPVRQIIADRATQKAPLPDRTGLFHLRAQECDKRVAIANGVLLSF